jgi:hypothetical protein
MTTSEFFKALVHHPSVIYGKCASGDLLIRDLLLSSGTFMAEEFERLMLTPEKMTQLRHGPQVRDNFGRCLARSKQAMGEDNIEASPVWA